MIRNFFLIAWRNLLRNKIYSFINIAGLSLGLACAMLIILYTKDEVSYDRFHTQGDRIYRIVSRTITASGTEGRPGGNTGYFHGPTFASQIPEISAIVRFHGGSKDVLKGSEVIREEVVVVDSNFFQVFSFPLLYGNAATALHQPNSVVLSEDMALKYFGTTDVVGKSLRMKEGEALQPFTVSAVAKRCPQNSSIKFGMVVPMRTPSDFDINDRMNWFNFFLNTFVVLAPGTQQEVTEKKMQQVFDTDAREAIARMAKEYDVKDSTRFLLQPLHQLHLGSDYGINNGLRDGSNPWYSYILSGIALFILLIACINFVNLTVARSLKRAREIGIRKVVGSSRRQLMMQFIGESFVLCVFAFAMAVVLVQLSLPVFNSLANKALSVSYLFDAKLVGGYLLLLVVTALLAGFYPALVLSSFDPVKTLYGRFHFAGKNYLQKALVVLQFSLATILIIGTITIYRQFNYMLSKPLGYDDQHLVTIENDDLSRQRFHRFRHDLLNNENILDVAPRNGGYWATAARINNGEPFNFAFETVGANHLAVLNIPLVQGRFFNPELVTDSTTSVVVNETFVKQARWKNPIGQVVDFFWQNRKMTVIGVVKDHHYSSLTEALEPQLMTMLPDNPYGMVFIRIKPGSDTRALSHIAATFKTNFPTHPYSFSFRADDNRHAYEAEAKWKQMLLFGALLTIFISCIGLFGLSVLNAEKRVKEVGIRKVLGASVLQITGKLTFEYLKLVSISLLVAMPLGWLAVNKWLQLYPYRISIGYSLFANAVLIIMLLAASTVSFQALRAAMSNPVKHLRSE